MHDAAERNKDVIRQLLAEVDRGQPRRRRRLLRAGLRRSHALPHPQPGLRARGRPHGLCPLPSGLPRHAAHDRGPRRRRRSRGGSHQRAGNAYRRAVRARSRPARVVTLTAIAIYRLVDGPDRGALGRTRASACWTSSASPCLGVGRATRPQRRARDEREPSRRRDRRRARRPGRGGAPDRQGRDAPRARSRRQRRAPASASGATCGSSRPGATTWTRPPRALLEAAGWVRPRRRRSSDRPRARRAVPGPPGGAARHPASPSPAHARARREPDGAGPHQDRRPRRRAVRAARRVGRRGVRRAWPAP